MKPNKFIRLHGKRFANPFLAAGVITVSLAGALAQAAEVTYPYYRFNPTTVPDGAVQLSEITLSLRGKKLNLNNTTGVGPVVNVTASSGTADPEGVEGAMKAVDGSVGTKWFGGAVTPIVLRFDTPVTIDSYNFASANDFNGRTPTAWTFQGSNDGEAWVDLDARTGYAPIYNNALFTYQTGFSVSRTGSPAISGVFASPAIVATGTPITVNYTTTNSPTSVVVTPGEFTGTATSTTFTPTVSGVYTIAATNGVSTTTATFNAKVVTPQTVNYQYIRYTPVTLRGANANSTQLAEFEFYNGTTKVPVTAVTNPGGNNPASGNEGPDKLIDGITDVAGNKYLDFNRFSPVVFDFGSVQTLTGYQFFTGGDAAERAPVRWTIEGSNDNATWTMIERVDANYPTDPGFNKPSGVLPFSYVASTPTFLTWAPTDGSSWDKVTANFSGATTIFEDGLNVVFDDTASSKAVTIAEQVFPNLVNLTNTEGNDYTFSGETLVGTNTLSKTGTGQVSFTAPTSVSGAISFTGGKVISTLHRGLGQGDATGAFVLDGGVTVELPESQYSQRPLVWGTATIDIAAEKTFASPGPKVLNGVLTKTGAGTLSFHGYNGSSATPTQKLIIDEGVVVFGTGSFNQTIFGGSRLKIQVLEGGVLSGTSSSSFGGDQYDYQTGIGQFRIEEGGEWRMSGGRQYLPRGYYSNNGVDEARIILKGGRILLDGTNVQLETANNNDTEADATRCTIATEASAMSSIITGAGRYSPITNFGILDVADGEAQDDLIIETVIEGRGFIKAGAGNLVLKGNNLYDGTTSTAAWGMPQGTTVRAGTLTVDNFPVDETSSATGTSPVLLAAGTTLAGTGQITGAVTANGFIAPGSSLSATGNLKVGPTVLVGGLISEVDGEDGADDFGDIIYGGDRLTVTGDLTITGATLSVTEVGQGATAASYVLVKYSGNLIGTFAGTPTLPDGYELVYDSAAKEIRMEGEPTEPTDPVGFEGWIAETDLTGEDAEASADPDGDGLPNLIEFIVGSNPETSGTEYAPTITRNATTGDVVFEFRRTSESAYLNPVVEYSVSLSEDWVTADAASVSVEANGFGTGVDKVTVTLPASLAEGGKLFARLKASL